MYIHICLFAGVEINSVVLFQCMKFQLETLFLFVENFRVITIVYWPCICSNRLFYQLENWYCLLLSFLNSMHRSNNTSMLYLKWVNIHSKLFHMFRKFCMFISRRQFTIFGECRYWIYCSYNLWWYSCLNFCDKPWGFFSLKVFQLLCSSLFIVISKTFRPICPPAFFRCLSNCSQDWHCNLQMIVSFEAKGTNANDHYVMCPAG